MGKMFLFRTHTKDELRGRWKLRGGESSDDNFWRGIFFTDGNLRGDIFCKSKSSPNDRAGGRHRVGINVIESSKFQILPLVSMTFRFRWYNGPCSKCR